MEVGDERKIALMPRRGRTRVGATLIEVLDEYADTLAEVGGRLYLSGVGAEMGAQLRRAGKLDLEDVVRLVPAETVLGASTAQALASASAWLGRTRAATSPVTKG